jgi:hypothetical protein
MKRIISFWQSLRIVRIVTVFLASTFLFFATACSPNNSVQAKTLDTKAYPEQYVPKNAVTNPREGGMNQFSDVDPRADRTGVEAKANALIEKAERNLSNRTENPAQAVKRVAKDAPNSPQEAGYYMQRNAENLGEKVKGSAEDFAKGTQRGIENIKENTQDAAADVKSSANQAASNVKQNAQDAAYKAKQAADDVSSYAKDKSHEAMRNTERGLDRLD